MVQLLRWFDGVGQSLTEYVHDTRVIPVRQGSLRSLRILINEVQHPLLLFLLTEVRVPSTVLFHFEA